MKYVLLAFGIILSVAAFNWWERFLASQLGRGQGAPEDAEWNLPDWPGIISAFLPPKARQIWTMFFLLIGFLILSLPPIFVFLDLFRQSDPTRQNYLNFIIFLAYWLLLLAFPASMSVRHQIRQGKSRGKNRKSSG